MTDEYVCTLSEELKKQAESELNEHPSSRDQNVMKLRKMVDDSADLKCSTDYMFLLRFLRAKKFDCNRSFAAMKRYCEVNNSHPKIFGDYTPSSVERIYRSRIVTVLPKPDAQGRRVIWFRPGLWDPDQYSMVEIFKAALLSMEWLLLDEATQIKGIAILEDCQGTCFGHLKQFSREHLKLMLHVVQEAFPIRMKVIHVINAPAFMKCVFCMARLFMTPKLRKRYLFHGKDITPLTDDLGEECIPVEYGGKLIVQPHCWADEMSPSGKAEQYFRTRFIGDVRLDAPLGGTLLKEESVVVTEKYGNTTSTYSSYEYERVSAGSV